MNANAAVTLDEAALAQALASADPVEIARRRVGAVIDGKYQIQSLLGVGTTGAVYRAQNRWAGRACAVKLFHYQGPGSDDVLRRFIREAQAIHRVQKNGRLHPHVVDALDVGRDGETGCYFVVQELLRGETLAMYLHRLPANRLSLRNALKILGPVMDAVACAHEGAVVHRDIKPENILLTRTSDDAVFPKVLDFGIAQIVDERVTPVNDLLGTPQYMPPEAFAGAGHVDARADVWGLGVVLYEMIAGTNPFAHSSDDPMASMDLVLHRTAPSLAAQNLVPPTLWNVIRRALSRPPSQRYDNARAMIEAIRVALRPPRVLRVGPGMTVEQIRCALSDVRGHSAPPPAPEARRTLPPPLVARTLPPPSMAAVTCPTAIARASIPMASPASTSPTMPPPANDATEVSEPDFTGNPADYWWTVNIQMSHHTADQIVEMLAMPELANVLELHISGCPLGDAGVAALTEGTLLRNLTALTLRRVGFSARGVAAIAGSSSLASLLKLDLEHNPIGPLGLRTLLASRHMTGLRALGLVLTDLDADAADALVESSKLRGLQRLDLSQNCLGDDGALRLVECGDLSDELWLGLSRNRLTQAGAARVTAVIEGRIRKLVL